MTKKTKERAAKKSTKNKVTVRSSKIGRKTKYDPKYASIAEKLCCDEGYTDENLANHFRVSRSTISKWKTDYPDFSDTIKKGKYAFDTVKVVQTLLKRALGYNYVETTKELSDGGVTVYDEDSMVTEQELVITKKVTKHLAPDVTAQIFWLKNRQPEDWSDSKEIDLRYGRIKEEPLTEEEIISHMKSIKEAGNGLDTKSINGNSN